ncbi:restriction endonuclease subunit S [Limosilactobacillus sp. c10Ua_36]|uniref:restriction endonuclease subunit S n=1 Tax=Limosilactobacillus sp. c10Ua_36 TaxID=2775910 RepID=UPI002DD63916|nr:restriction endonuclease subunit S [Limosilactobacillus sp. c10Ua_36]
MKKTWEQHKLGEITIDMYNGQTPSRNNSEFWKGNIPWLTSGELNHDIITDTVEKITKLGQKDKHLRLIKKGTFVIAITGLEAPGTRGNCALLGIDTTINQSVMAIYPDHKKVTSDFLFDWYEKVGTEYGITYTQGTKQQSYNVNLLSILPIMITHNLKEQYKISQLLKITNRLISLQQRKLEQLKQLKKVMLQRLFVQNKEKLVPIIRFNNFNIQWRLNTLNGLQENVYSGLSGKTKIDFGHGDARYITYLNVHDNIIAKVSGIDKIEKDLNQNKVEKGDILFTISSEVPEEVALNSVWPSNYGKDLYLNSFCFGYRPIPGKVNPFFLSYYLRTPFLRKNVFPLAQGISRFNISKKNILNISIAIPSLEEQNSIYKLLAELDKILDQKKMNINQFKAIKKFLLQKLFI